MSFGAVTGPEHPKASLIIRYWVDHHRWIRNTEILYSDPVSTLEKRQCAKVFLLQKNLVFLQVTFCNESDILIVNASCNTKPLKVS